MSARKRIVGQSASVFAAQIIGLSCAVLNSFLIAKVLGPTGKGLLYSLQLVAATGPALLSFGLGPAAVYYLGKQNQFSEREIRSRVLWSSLLLGSVPVLAFLAFRPILVPIAQNRINPQYLALGLSTLPFGVLAWNAGYICLAQGRIFAFNLLRSGQSVWFLLGSCALLLIHRASLVEMAFCWAASVMLLGAVAPFATAKKFSKRIVGENGFLLEAFRFGWKSHLGAVTQFFQQRVDILLIGYFCSLREVGLYSLAVGIAELLWYIPQTIASLLMPHVAGSMEEVASRLTSSFCRTVFAINASLSLLLAAISGWIIPALLPAFHGSVAVLWLLLPGTVAASVSKVLSSDLNGRGKPMETFRPALVSLVFCLLAGLVVIPRGGIRGAAAVTSAGYMVNTFLYLHAYVRITAVRASDLLLLKHRDLSALRSYWKGFASEVMQ